MRACLALALPVLLTAGQAHAHDWFEGLLSPHGVPCCGENDCRAVPYRLNAETGQEEVEVNGQWWPVDPDKVPAFTPPDGKVYACWDQRQTQSFPLRKPPNFHCIILPRMSSLDAPSAGMS